MSLLVTWLVLSLLSATSAQNTTSDQTLNLAQNPTDKTPHNDNIETETSAPGHQDEPNLHSQNEHRDEMPHLKFNPPDLIPFPKEGHLEQFWQDHPDFKAIPDLPAKDTEYPKWLLRVMGRIPPTTPASKLTENNDQVLLSRDSRPHQQPEVKPLDSRTSESESGKLVPEILPRRNDMESRFESNNIPVQRGNGNTEFLLPPEIPIQRSFLNSRMQQFRPVPVPNDIQRPTVGRVRPDFSQNQNGPILFRIPLNLGFGRIQHMRSSNTRRNPNNFVIMRDNKFESRPFSTEPVQIEPMQRRNFRGIPVTLSRPSVVHQPGILMLPVRNQNVPSRFNPHNFIQSRPQRMFPAREWFAHGQNQNRPQNPSFARQNEIHVDPQFSRESLSEDPVQDENSQRIPTVTNRRQEFVMPGKQADTLQNANGSSPFPRRSGIGARNKRQSGFDSFDPFGMGNIFSFFPQEKEEPQNSFNWFPQESMMNNPTQQPPVRSGGFNPNANQRPVKPPPKQHRTFPQDSWVVMQPSSNNAVPNFHVQNPQTNHGSNNKQIPEDFMIIRPDKVSPQRGGSNKMPWMLSNMFGGDIFPENNGNQMWTFQRPFDDHPGTNNKQPPHTNRGQFSNNVQTRPSRNDQQFHVQPPVPHPFQNFHPSRGQPQHSHLDNNIQRPSNHLPPPRNNQGHIQATSHLNPAGTHVQPQRNWRPASQRPSQPQLPAVPHGTWIPRESTHKKAPDSRMNHFHEIPAPHHQQPHHHHPEKQPPRAAAHHEDRHPQHRRPVQPEIRTGKRKLSPSEVRHLLSLLPEFPKEIHKKPLHGNKKSQTVGLTIKATGNKQKRAILESADIDDGNLTRNYPGSKFPVSSRNPQSPKDRRKRDIEESLMQDVVFGSYGYHSGYEYDQGGSYSDFSGPFSGFKDNNNHDSGNGDSWGSMFPKKSHSLFNGVWDWPNHGYYKPHLGFGHFPHGHAAGHYHPHHHHGDYWHGDLRPVDQGRLAGGSRVVVIPPAVPRADPNQLSYTARFRYRFGIYPGYSDYIPSTDDHEIFFFYDAKQGDRSPDALIPFRSY